MSELMLAQNLHWNRQTVNKYDSFDPRPLWTHFRIPEIRCITFYCSHWTRLVKFSFLSHIVFWGANWIIWCYFALLDSSLLKTLGFIMVRVRWFYHQSVGVVDLWFRMLLKHRKKQYAAFMTLITDFFEQGIYWSLKSHPDKLFE